MNLYHSNYSAKAFYIHQLDSLSRLKQAALIVQKAIYTCKADHCGCEETRKVWHSNVLTHVLTSKHVYYSTDAVEQNDDNSSIFAVASMTADGELTTLYVDPAFKLFGHGKAMLQFMEGIARDAEIPVVDLESSATARPFYMRYGYREILGMAPKRGAGKSWNFPMHKEIERALL